MKKKAKGFGNPEPGKRQEVSTQILAVAFQQFVALVLEDEHWSEGCVVEAFFSENEQQVLLTVPKESHQRFRHGIGDSLALCAFSFGLSGFKIVLSPLTRAALWELKQVTNRGGQAK